MFGKTKESSDIDERAEHGIAIDDFFGDETAVAEAVRVDQLHQRVTHVEQQISSQFTSLAAYAQIAQEQVELVRAEAQHASERSEQRVVGLIERERADRIESSSGGGTDVSIRLDSLDAQVAEIRDGLQQCLSNQKALADAITELFTPSASPAHTVPTVPAAARPDPTIAEPVTPAVPSTDMPPALSFGSPAPELLMAAPSVSSQDPSLPPPPVEAFSFDNLDRELQELGIDMRAELASDPIGSDHFASDDLVAIEPIDTARFAGPIDGLSLA